MFTHSPGCCCCNVLVIAIINTNAIKDDNFQVRLNGTLLGTIDNSGPGCSVPPNFCSGRLFSTDDSITTYTGIPACSASYNLEPTIEIDPALLITGSNTLRITSVNNAGCGNFGAVHIVCINPDGSGGGTIGKTLLNSTYGMISLTFQDFTFTYP